MTPGTEMNHNTEHTASTDRSEHSRMKISMQPGIEAWFDVDDITICIWASSWIGREIVTIRVDGRERVVSDRYSWRFRTPHEFSHNGHRYRVDLSVGFGKAAVELYRDDVLIDSDQINRSGIRIDPATGKLDWGHTMKRLVVPLLAGVGCGVAFGYLVGVVLK